MAEKLEYTDIIVEKKPPIGYITINRPERRNAISTIPGGSVAQLDQAFIDMREDPEIRVFVVKGAGDCFCSGFFQQAEQTTGLFGKEAKGWMKDVAREPWARYARDKDNPESRSLAGGTMFSEGLWNNPKPSIAQVDSYCLGAGIWLINQCDIVYATPEAIFSYPPIRRGASIVLDILPPWLLGRRRTLWMALTGQAITAQEAYDSGLITKIVPRDKIEEEVWKIAESIARVPPNTNMFSKMAINNYYEGLGIEQARRLSSAFVNMTENSAAPGHYFEYYVNIEKMGFREANRIQMEKWGYTDEVQEKERARLKAKK